MKWCTDNFLAVLGLAFLAACDRHDMYQQPKYAPMQPNPFYENQQSARPVVPGTVARGQLRTNSVYYSGLSGTNYLQTLPMTVTPSLLARGQERYNIYCAPCHDRLGTGNGMIVQRGFRAPASFHIDRLRSVPAGYFYDVTSRGIGTMADFAAELTPDDRWAVAAYIRALQLSQHATVADIPPAQRSTLEVRRP